jgi:hypothetical protein
MKTNPELPTPKTDAVLLARRHDHNAPEIWTTEDVHDLITHARHLERDLETSRRQHSEYVSGQITIEEIIIENGGFTAALGTEMAHCMAEAFYTLLKEREAVNYVECQFTRRDCADRISVTVAYAHGKTPHELRVDAETRVKALEESLRLKTAESESWESTAKLVAKLPCGHPNDCAYDKNNDGRWANIGCIWCERDQLKQVEKDKQMLMSEISGSVMGLMMHPSDHPINGCLISEASKEKIKTISETLKRYE